MPDLILLRHAKSSWDHPELADHDRPLNPRGRRSAAAMGNWLRRQGAVPDEVFCSSARRTRETFELLGMDVPVRIDRALYHAEPEEMLEVLRAATGERVLMLGHNPGMAEFAERLLTEPPDHPRFFDFPTCAALIARFDMPWAEVDWRTGQARAFAIPRELPELS